MVDTLLGNHGARARRLVVGEINFDVGLVQTLCHSITGKTVRHWEPLGKPKVAIQLNVQVNMCIILQPRNDVLIF